MSFVTTQPESLAKAAGNLQGIGSAMTAGNAAAAAPTTGVVPAAADEVSALTAAQFAAHAEHVPGGERPSRGDSRDVCEHAGDQRRIVCGHRGRQRGSGALGGRGFSMDYGALTPEINSARMYAGPGSGSMLAAASAWDGLAAELHSTASSFGSVISGLTDGSWVGPSSTAMAAAATPYVAWLNAAAGEAEQAASSGQGGGGRL